jgi:hypothetical protein
MWDTHQRSLHQPASLSALLFCAKHEEDHDQLGDPTTSYLLVIQFPWVVDTRDGIMGSTKVLKNLGNGKPLSRTGCGVRRELNMVRIAYANLVDMPTRIRW